MMEEKEYHHLLKNTNHGPVLVHDMDPGQESQPLNYEKDKD